MKLAALVSDNAVLLGGGLVLLFVVNRVVWYFRLRRFGGPFWAGLSDWPHSLAMLQGRCHEWYADVSEKHGPIARVAPTVLITSSPDVWAHVNSRPGYKRSDWYYNACRLEHRRDNVFSQTDNREHDRRRKQMAPGYSGRENLDLERTVDERIADLIALIRTRYGPTAESPTSPPLLDLAQKLQFLTLDVISSVGLGRSFGTLRADADTQGFAAIAEGALGTANTALALGLREVDEAVAESEVRAEPGAGAGAGLGPTIISAARAQQLPYLQAVVRESLRVFPPVANIFSRDVPAGGDTVLVDGQPVFLPGGASIGYSAFAMHRSRALYGPDAALFRPERWFDKDPARLAAMVRTNELIFGHGRFHCLGRPVAMLEISKTIFELMRHFEMAIVNPTRPWNARNSVGLFMISDMWVQVTMRS
ncbi:hypothetical protein HIM_08519 [Hirsutella minnesotensis 3608]|uniref:Pisatin demethylase n=1 Tax=Hirsutella minnesotensis 3608 TaxID=1043627 RepID=A0A0F8A3M0_9HYPO|nr:hypothetical protein HIM_08519 [Hirsutella minnesotensis 3608]